MKKLILILFYCIALLFTSCTKNNESISENENKEEEIMYKKISASEAKKIIDNEDIIILDVRTIEEYNEGHIEDSILLPYTEIAGKSSSILPNKDKKILIYCRSGRRSAIAAKELIAMGYTDVYDFGGIIDWEYEVVK